MPVLPAKTDEPGLELLDMAYLWHMRTTIEMPDELLREAKGQAALRGLSLREFFISAVEEKLKANQVKQRKAPPLIKGTPRVTVLTAEQIDEALFG